MRETKRHQVTATVFDIFVIGSLLQIPFAVISSIGKFPFPIMSGLILGLGYILILIIYHSFFARRVSFCTPGETMAGASIVEEQKIWESPFTISRWFLFLCVLILLLYPGNAFDNIWQQPWPFPRVIGTSIFTLLFLYAAFRIVRGFFWWGFAPLILLGIQILVVTFSPAYPQDMKVTIIGMNTFVLVLLAITILIYAPKKTE
jgi:hypothetical protein